MFDPDPIYKGPEDSSPTLKDSLVLKNEESPQDLDEVFRLRKTNVPTDLEIARFHLERLFRNENGTANDELRSTLYALRGDLLIRGGKSAEAISHLENACELNPDSWEASILLLRAYKMEDHKLRNMDRPWSADQQRRIYELGDKIEALEEELREYTLSLIGEISGGGGGLRCERNAGNNAWAPFDETGYPQDGFVRLTDIYNLDLTADLVVLSGCETALGREVRGEGLVGLTRDFMSAEAPRVRTSLWRVDDPATTKLTESFYRHLHLEMWPAAEALRRAQLDVLAVGVNGNGTAGLGSLKHAAADAQRVSTALRDLDFQSTVLTNTAATRQKILAALWREVQASRPGDVFVFYFSGHGFTDINGHPVLVTGGGTKGAQTKGAYTEILSLEEINYVLSFHRGRAVVILDNCLTAMQLDGGNPRRTAAGPNQPTIILAGAPGGRVIESPRLGSGLFTYTLLRFLEQQRTPELDFNEMFRYTAVETARLARDLYGVSQRPQWLLAR